MKRYTGHVMTDKCTHGPTEVFFDGKILVEVGNATVDPTEPDFMKYTYF